LAFVPVILKTGGYLFIVGNLPIPFILIIGIGIDLDVEVVVLVIPDPHPYGSTALIYK